MFIKEYNYHIQNIIQCMKNNSLRLGKRMCMKTHIVYADTQMHPLKPAQMGAANSEFPQVLLTGQHIREEICSLFAAKERE